MEGQPEKTSPMAGIVEDVISVDVEGRKMGNEPWEKTGVMGDQSAWLAHTSGGQKNGDDLSKQVVEWSWVLWISACREGGGN